MEQLQKKAITYQWKDVIKRGMFALSIPLISLTYPLINQYRGNTNDLFTFVDKLIPFNKFFILPYISWYIFIAIFSVILCIYDKEKYFKLLITLDLGMIMCYIIYYFYPTYVPRPIILGTDFFSNLVLRLYAVDNPYNCFPSIHVLNSVLITLYIYESEMVSKCIKAICIIMSFSIVLSTMFIKQHYFADVIAGIIFAFILYFCFKSLKFNFDKDDSITYIE
ncbi:phosphatase PAP2 family protein [Clostridium estertheticum]|uniref:phosphatase PAP2 family protein n=1 Tax=Clostridium estertheticum TaxID=238834 RepID=UPI001CF4E8E4|nr:phosphatase PAP2 family protein [Clostridium estertheticum]MCB2356233.1 phosphatase PAP2 family protein [Clostridium estertheticum]WAG41361.1 phosphatase PAP2 family protein [Clostridium estertheticum]